MFCRSRLPLPCDQATRRIAGTVLGDLLCTYILHEKEGRISAAWALSGLPEFCTDGRDLFSYEHAGSLTRKCTGRGEQTKVRHGAIATILGLAIAVIGSAVAWSQPLGRPDNVVWQVSASHLALRSVYLAPDSRHGWAVGEKGTIIATDAA